jgi:hypothetical protein
MESKEYFDQT